MDYVGIFNFLEVILWSVIGVYFAIRSVTTGPRVRCVLASLGFIAFGLSDAVEIKTGAWWRPWWLFVWKAACVVLLVGLAVESWRKRANSENNAV